MGTIIEELFKKIPSDEVVVQIKEICKEIWEQEKEAIEYHQALPKGANIFLAIRVPSKNKGEVSFLTVERDPMEEYISNYYSIKIKYIQNEDIYQMPRKYQSHKLEGRSAMKILTEFAKLIKFYRGE